MQSATRLEKSSDIWRARKGLAWFPLDRPLGISMARIVEFHDHPMGEGAATPAQVAPIELLAAAREQLHNPPELAVSPDVMRQ